MSADLFGMVATNSDDLNIGQVLERAEPYFDYLSPMVYPSHYPKDYNNFANPTAGAVRSGQAFNGQRRQKAFGGFFVAV